MEKVLRFSMEEISRSLRELISEDLPRGSGSHSARAAIFREVFIYHYPDFLDKIQSNIPKITKEEEVICMLIALEQSQDQIAELFCLAEDEIYMLHKFVSAKMDLQALPEGWLQDILEE